MKSTSLFIFRRDLRLDDNTALLAALSSSEEVIPAFIFDPRQIDDNAYRGQNCVEFMVESLADLDEQLKLKGGRLFVFYGKAEDVVRDLLSNEGIHAVYVNRDYTPFSRSRDGAILRICESKKVAFHSFGDALLNEPEDIQKIGGGVYTIYTPFMKQASSKLVRKPCANKFTNYRTKAVRGENTEILKKLLGHQNPLLAATGGRTEAKKILKKLDQFKNYDDERNIPSLGKTTYLSAHNKFGTVSIREVYYSIHARFGPDHTLIRELYWRDFFSHVGFHFPHVMKGCFHKAYDALEWDNDPKKFKAWCEGKTGFPIVDAGMRELNATGFMHNRLRMITASFLVKDLHIHWQWGEKYFAQMLVDYDPLVNNGNWQWAASTGCDAQPYFRIFNPALQMDKFDPKGEYIKRWLTTDVNTTPIVDHKTQAQKAQAMFRRVRSQ